MRYAVELAGKTFHLELDDSFITGAERGIKVGDTTYRLRVNQAHGCVVLTDEKGVERMLRVRRSTKQKFDGESHSRVHVELLASAGEGLQKGEMQIGPDIPGQAQREKQAAASDLVIRSQITGKVLTVEVKTGDTIEQGATLAIIEAMKMENRIFAPAAGSVLQVSVKAGDSVATGRELFKIKRDGT